MLSRWSPTDPATVVSSRSPTANSHSEKKGKKGKFTESRGRRQVPRSPFRSSPHERKILEGEEERGKKRKNEKVLRENGEELLQPSSSPISSFNVSPDFVRLLGASLGRKGKEKALRGHKRKTAR